MTRPHACRQEQCDGVYFSKKISGMCALSGSSDSKTFEKVQ